MTVSHAKKFVGTVESDSGQKTVVVKVVSLKRHSKYHKQYATFKRYQAHDENNEYHVGDTVEIQEARPLSKHKTWKVLTKIK